jgi:hypothetical protein
MTRKNNFYSVLSEYKSLNMYKGTSLEDNIMMNNDNESLEKILKFFIVPTVSFASLIMTGVILFALYLIYSALVKYNPTIWDMLGSKAL